MRLNRLNLLFTLSSLSVLLVTVERFSFTTTVFLSPYRFLRLHEAFQIIVIILLTVIIPYFLFKEVTQNFDLLRKGNGSTLGLLFIIGIYFYATGNGVHEVASFFFNTYCDTKRVAGDVCGGMFFNDYYFGNILYFIGAFLMNIVLLVFERIKPAKPFSQNDVVIMTVNALIYSFAIFAYAAFDRVLVGLVYSVVMLGAIAAFFFTRKVSYRALPVTTYLFIIYLVGTLASLVVRFR